MFYVQNEQLVEFPRVFRKQSVKEIRCIVTTVFLLLPLAGSASTQYDSTSDQALTALKPELRPSQERNWKLLLGNWYGNQPTDEGGPVEWFTYRHTDGGYITVFHLYDTDGKRTEQIEFGAWGVSGPVYFTVFMGRFVDGKLSANDEEDPYTRDAYRIIALDAESFVYEHFEVGNMYTTKKLPPDFEYIRRKWQKRFE